MWLRSYASPFFGGVTPQGPLTPLSIKDCNLGVGGGVFHKAVRKVTNDFTNDLNMKSQMGCPKFVLTF